MSNKNGSVAPKERINIKYTPATGDQQSEIELPLKLLVTGDFTGKPQEDSVEERQTVRVDKHSFNSVMEESDLGVETTVKNALDEDADSEIAVNLQFKSLADFSPDNIAKQVPELDKLLQLREALLALKGPMGNIPAFRNKLQELISDEASREQLEKELQVVLSENEEK
ncbi:MAG: type VI secretion system contractile sheath small subunit [Pasteurella sp.]|nr:type VI secretion system contractile sheath small subunit [Pasteurella sp.]PID51295.1 MAG: type VI secretion system contractile sheath small subunit [Pasteurellales bacterium]